MLTASSSGTKQAPLIEAGLHEAVCYTIADIGTVHSDFYEKDQRKVVLIWEIPDSRIDTDRGNLPRALSKRYTNTLGLKSTLRKDLVSWRTKDFTPEEELAFDLHKILGASCFLNIVHKTKQDGTQYASIDAVLPLKGKRLKLENPAIIYGIEENGLDIPGSLPPWLVEEIKKSPEYQAILHPDTAPQADFGAGDDMEPAADTMDAIPF